MQVRMRKYMGEGYCQKGYFTHDSHCTIPPFALSVTHIFSLVSTERPNQQWQPGAVTWLGLEHVHFTACSIDATTWFGVGVCVHALPSPLGNHLRRKHWGCEYHVGVKKGIKVSFWGHIRDDNVEKRESSVKYDSGVEKRNVGVQIWDRAFKMQDIRVDHGYQVRKLDCGIAGWNVG